jgi:hypothetical protein
LQPFFATAPSSNSDQRQKALKNAHVFLDGEAFWDEEKADDEAYDNTPALEAFQENVAGEELAAFLAGMRIEESAELRCKDGTFEIVRDR